MTFLDEQLTHLARYRERGTRKILSDREWRRQVERDLQLAAHAVIDVASHLVATWTLGGPDEYRGVFETLAKAGRMDCDLAPRMGDWAGLRNVLVHLYVGVDPSIVARTVMEDLGDLEAFLRGARTILVLGTRRPAGTRRRTAVRPTPPRWLRARR